MKKKIKDLTLGQINKHCITQEVVYGTSKMCDFCDLSHICYCGKISWLQEELEQEVEINEKEN